jgi:hypothetical protein
MKKIILLLIGLAVVIVIISISISDRETFYSTMGGAAIGFLGGLFVYQVGSYIEEREKKAISRENTIHIYQLYSEELEMNSLHLKHLIERKWIPYYKLKSITRNSMWGQLADYSRDPALMKKLNYIYGEFELINNKIDMMNAARLAEISCIQEKDKKPYKDEIGSQLAGAIELGKKVLPNIEEALKIIRQLICSVQKKSK